MASGKRTRPGAGNKPVASEAARLMVDRMLTGAHGVDLSHAAAGNVKTLPRKVALEMALAALGHASPCARPLTPAEVGRWLSLASALRDFLEGKSYGTSLDLFREASRSAAVEAGSSPEG